MRSLITLLTLLFVSLLLMSGCSGEKSETPAENDSTTAATGETTSTAEAGTPEATLTIINSASERVPVRVEIANTRDEQERGLMERTELPEDAGMLFVFNRERILSFWMKNTLIPLSIAYINSDRRIIDIQEMQPLDETTHPSAEPAQYALEVNQGFFADHGIEVGNEVELPE